MGQKVWKDYQPDSSAVFDFNQTKWKFISLKSF